MPRLARYLLGEGLLLNSPQTYWCGDKKERQHVFANLDRLLIKSTVRVPGLATHYGRLLDSEQREALRRRIEAQPYLYVGQEELPPATIPTYVDGLARAAADDSAQLSGSPPTMIT